MSSENQVVEAALEKHEKDKQGKHLVINDNINEVSLIVNLYFQLSCVI